MGGSRKASITLHFLGCISLALAQGVSRGQDRTPGEALSAQERQPEGHLPALESRPPRKFLPSSRDMAGAR